MLEHMASSHKSKCEDLLQRNLKLQELVEDNTIEMKLHLAERETSEAVLRAKQLTEEMTELRAARDEAVAQSYETKLQAARATKELEGQIAQLRAQNRALENRESQVCNMCFNLISIYWAILDIVCL
jgi:hypothetical protein